MPTLNYSTPADERVLQQQLRHAPRNGVEAYDEATFGSRHPYRSVLLRTGVYLAIAVPLAAIFPRPYARLIGIVVIVAIYLGLILRELKKLANPSVHPPLHDSPRKTNPTGPGHVPRSKTPR